MLTLEDGSCPFEDWFNSIRDLRTSVILDARLARVESGALGDHENVGGGVWELKIDFGPGYRIYYAEHNRVIVVLLGGGAKKQQQADIARARKLWEGSKDDSERLQRDLRPQNAE